MTPIQDLLPNVSRETLDRLSIFAELVRKWNPKVNLIAKSTVDDIWQRHIKDSAQIYKLAPADTGKWADLGSGGGFPALVVAILAHDAGHELDMNLIEADQRKAVFLREVIRQLDLNATVTSERIEACTPFMADVVSARALASLDILCGYAAKHMKTNGQALFLKGAKSDEEILAARNRWAFDLHEVKSLTSPESKILILSSIKNV